MKLCLCTGAALKCSFGSTPAIFSSLPTSGVIAEGRPVGIDTDMVPILNLASFGLCKSLSNPTVASATTAAMGTLTPMPCVPVPGGSWKRPESKVLIGGRPALTSSSTLTCAWGGQISVQFAGQTSVEF